jgi:hypothetical protein
MAQHRKDNKDANEIGKRRPDAIKGETDPAKIKEEMDRLDQISREAAERTRDSR